MRRMRLGPASSEEEGAVQETSFKVVAAAQEAGCECRRDDGATVAPVKQQQHPR